MDELITISLEGCTENYSEARKFQRLLKRNYNIIGKPKPCLDCVIWHLTGTVESLRKMINEQWNPGGCGEINLYDAAVMMSKKDFENLYGVKSEDYL